MESKETLLAVQGLKTHFFTDEGTVKAVDGVDFEIRQGDTVGIVGESGCGKTVTAYSILQLIEKPGRIVGGQITYYPNHGQKEGIDLAALPAHSKAMRAIRGGGIAMIFQEPMNSLSPIHTIGDQIVEAILLHQDLSKAAAYERTIELLTLVGIPDAKSRIDAYSFQFSGGMRQRAMIAMALASQPNLLIADEPTTALDVTTQAQIIELMQSLQAQFGMAVMLITHDLGVVAEMCHEVVVMYLGEVVERADVETLFSAPAHPYTQALLRSIPRLGSGKGQHLDLISGSIPDPYNRPSGCPFHPRCKHMIAGKCDTVHPALTQVAERHTVRCFLYETE
jgi:oligopeptide/dipeptide ABC transporter ATP-binding protein